MSYALEAKRQDHVTLAPLLCLFRSPNARGDGSWVRRFPMAQRARRALPLPQGGRASALRLVLFGLALALAAVYLSDQLALPAPNGVDQANGAIAVDLSPNPIAVAPSLECADEMRASARSSHVSGRRCGLCEASESGVSPLLQTHRTTQLEPRILTQWRRR